VWLQTFVGILAWTILVVIATDSSGPRCTQSFKPPCVRPPAPGYRSTGHRAGTQLTTILQSPA